MVGEVFVDEFFYEFDAEVWVGAGFYFVADAGDWWYILYVSYGTRGGEKSNG